METIIEKHKSYLEETYYIDRNKNPNSDYYTDLSVRINPNFYDIKHLVKLIYNNNKKENKENYYYKIGLIMSHEDLLFNNESISFINRQILGEESSLEIGSIKITGNTDKVINKLKKYLDNFLTNISNDKNFYKRMKEKALKELK